MSSHFWTIPANVIGQIALASEAADVVLEARCLTKRYGDRIALNGLDFSVRRGETLGLLGPNGAGKTTAMHLLAGLLKPDEGSVVLSSSFDGRRGRRERIGIAPQSMAVYPGLSAEENLRFFARLHGLSGAHLADRVAWALELAGLTGRRRERVRSFSGGMMRRLNVACAVVHEPDVLLLDEPTVGVDPQSRNHLFDALEELKDQGLTILYSTHYMEEAERLCDRVAIMDAGQVLALDSVAALVREHGGGTVVDAALDQASDLSRLRAAGVPEPERIEGRRLRWRTERPLQVTEVIAATGVPLRTLNVHSPDLETVFFALTGKGLRD